MYILINVSYYGLQKAFVSLLNVRSLASYYIGAQVFCSIPNGYRFDTALNARAVVGKSKQPSLISSSGRSKGPAYLVALRALLVSLRM